MATALPTKSASPNSDEQYDKTSYTSQDDEKLLNNSTNASPYAVPQYDFQPSRPSESSSTFPALALVENPTLNIFISGSYVAVAVLSIIQGFGILVFGTFRSILLAAYLMFFGIVTILYDLRIIAGKFVAEDWFPFLGHNVGRGLTCCFLGILCSTTYYPTGWNTFIMIFSIVVGCVHLVLYLFSPSKTSENEVFNNL